MRRLILFAASFLLCIVQAGAEVVTLEKARATAESFFGTTKSAGLQLVWTGPGSETKGDSSDAPAFYVFNSANGGFVMVSGDDIVAPILGYSFDGQFVADDMPENVKAWFSDVEEYIRQGRSLGVEAYENSGRQYAAADSGVLIKTPSWSQTSPYNNLCPKYNGEETMAGCVAVAMAEILWPDKYPVTGTGTVPSYVTTTNSISVSENVLGAYDWENMPEKHDRSWTEENENAVARLIYDCGTMVQADYCTDGTGAVSEDVIPALVKYMGMDASAVIDRGDFYTTEDWLSKLKAEIDRGRAIYYSARTASNEGHAFVVDGYDADMKFHINFGWGGKENGYYEFPNFGPEGTVFINRHQAILGLKPDEGGKSTSLLALIAYYDGDSGLTSDVVDFVPGEEFRVNVNGLIYNSCSNVFSGDFVAGRVDEDGNIVEVISGIDSEKNVEPGYGTYGAYYDCVCSQINKGDRVMMIFRQEGDTDWQLMPYDHQTEDFSGMILLCEELTPEGLAKRTSFSYNKEEQLITMKSLKGVSCTLTDDSGTDYGAAVSVEDSTVEIETADLPRICYTITLTVNGITKSFKVDFNEN